jgi:predicted branched-subunit amino acid permease
LGNPRDADDGRTSAGPTPERHAAVPPGSVDAAAPAEPAEPAEPTFADGVRAGLPLLLPTLLVGISFGVAARSLGWGWVAPVVMSIVVYSGSAQFASTGVLAAGGGLGAAIGAATLANLRFLPLGLLAAPATRGGPLRRVLEGQTVVDASVLLALHEGRVRRGLVLGSTVPQFVGWVGGTAIGAASGLGADADKYGIDVIFPAFFLVLLAGELRGAGGAGARRVAAAGALLALALIPVAPPGVPVVVATLAALLGMRR